MIEQEMASIIKFVLESANNPAPFYWKVPKHFEVPAVYFPPPEISTGGETLLTYNMDFSWYIKIFHKTEQGAYSLGHSIVTAVRAARNLIPLILVDGSIADKSWVRIDDPTLKVIDSGAAQMTINWRSRRPYKDTEEQSAQAKTFNFDVLMKSGRQISDAYAAALENYSIPYNSDGN